MIDQRQPREGRTDLLPSFILLTAAVLLLTGFFLYQAISQRSALPIRLGSQEQQLKQAQQVKQQVDALASATAKLAQEGDPGAKKIIDGMKAQGITVHPRGR